jgi:uncharacterized protein (UPF0371 family)
MIDPFHLEAYGKTAVNYNRDVEIFPVLHAIFKKIQGESPYKSPTDMGVNMVGNCIVDDAVCCEASRREILRRYYTACVERLQGKNDDETVQRLELVMQQADVTTDVCPAVSAALLIALWPITSKLLKPKIIKTNVDAIVGTEGYVTVDIDNLSATGRVKLNAMEWAARSTSAEPIKAGTLVKVDRIEGVKAFVSAVKNENI